MAAALGFLRKGPVALEPLDADGQQQLVLVHQRGGQPRIGLAPLQRHPIDAVVGEQIEPFLQPVLVDQPRLVDDEIDELLIGRRAHGTPPSHRQRHEFRPGAELVAHLPFRRAVGHRRDVMPF